MKYCATLLLLLTLSLSAVAQTMLRISGDTVKIVKGELQIQNTTSNVNGALFNIDNGRTAFQKIGARIQFIAGSPFFPQPGDSIYINQDFAGQAIRVWRNGLLQYRDITNGIIADSATGSITFHPPLVTGDRIYIESINGVSVSANDNNIEPPATSPALKKLYAGIFDNGDQTYTLRWTTNAKTLFLLPRVVGIGSSTLAGYNVSAPYRLGDKISAWLGNNVTNAVWRNLAVSGNSSIDLLPVANGGMGGANIDSAVNANSDFIFLSLASNDPAAGISVNQSIANYKKMDSIALSRGVPIFFETTQPRSAYNAAMQTMLKEMADSIRKIWPDRYVEGFLDVVDKNAATAAAILPQYDNGDGIHLNPNGNQFIADRLFDRWANYFRFTTGVKRYLIDTSNNLSAWAPFDTIPDKNVVKKTYAKRNDKRLYFRVKAELSSGAFSDYSSVAVLKEYVAPPLPTVYDHRILIDLGGDNATTLNGSSQKDGKPTPSPDGQGKIWNNWYGTGDVRGFIDSAAIFGLKTATAEQTTISLRLLGNPQGDFATSIATQAINFNGYKTAVSDYPAEAGYDNMFIHNTAGSGNGITLRLKNLTPSNTYYIKIWGARVDSSSSTPRNLQGKIGSSDWVGAQTVNTRYAGMNFMNYDNALNFNNITGVDSLNINLRTAAGSTFSHVSVIDIGIMGTLPPAPKIGLRDSSIVGSTIQLIPVITTAGYTFTSYQWTQLAGPATAVISTPTNTNTVISNLSNGIFSFRLAGTTSAGINVSGDVVIKVFPDNNGKKMLRVNFSDTKMPEIPGWLNAYGPANANFVTYTDPQTNWTVDNVSNQNTYWSGVSSSNSSDVNGYNTGNNTGVIPDIALKSFWFNYSVGYTAGKENVILSGLNPAKTYTIKLYGSRTSAGGTTGPRYGVWRINGSAEYYQNALDNSTLETVVMNIVPDASGKIKIAVYRASDPVTYGPYSYLNALILLEN